MKTTFKAKIVFEIDKYVSLYYTKANGGKKILTLDKIKDVINNEKCDIEMIAGELGTDNESTIIITHKNNE